MPSPLDRQNMNATVYSRKRPIEIVICFGGNGRPRPGPNLGALFGSVKFRKVIRRLQRDIECAAFICPVGLWRVRRWGETVYRLLAIYMIGSGVVMIFASSAISVRIVNVRR